MKRSAAPIVVVPAHDEASVIERGLRAILQRAEPGEFDVLVVSNGSADDTAQRARAVGAELGRSVHVLEIPTASKVAALRAAERWLATERPLASERQAARIYVDADVVVSTDTIRLLTDAVSGTSPRLGLVIPDVDTSASGRVVRSYYRAWEQLARARGHGAGSGVLAVNAGGAPRVREWPDVLNDDGYVVRQFRAEETVVVEATATQYATRSLSSLVRRRARVVIGNRELDERWPRGRPTGSGRFASELRAAVVRRQVSPFAAVTYVAVTAAARALAAWRLRVGTERQWSRDASSRGTT